MTDHGTGRQVRRRRVFYIPGYDPVPPRRYRELYRRESASQARVSGYQIALGKPVDQDVFGWHVTARIENHEVTADFEVLVWSDIVRASMSDSIVATYGQMLRTVWVYVGSGALWPLMRLRKGPVLAALYPVAMLCLQAVLAMILGWIVMRLAGLGLPWVAAAVLGVAAAVLMLRWFRTVDGRLFAHYLMHDFAFTAQLKGAYPPELETRLAVFGDRIAAALLDDVDEVLVVGHSSGAYLAVSVLADLMRAGRVRRKGAALGFLSLGQVVPMASFLPRAERLRRDLRDLSLRDELCWVDVSAPGDGCSFALCDPVAVSGVAPKEQRWPLVLSAAFSQTLSPEKQAALRHRFFRLHFQYLCAFDRPGAYDYFRITAGPRTLCDRFAEQAPSPSRIHVPVSRHVSVA
ncbi:hypothetical protein [Sedimentitalea arenosa]|uniref:Uncharacterized protein n=1 Tax=Sedimentitalea arenosa TaxID=2798803 RepID=A0A8J7LVD3_9RHOB|nr:hypothetical protein [Arenibacterium arenosum]MBJ6370731.1 hypothetical protein [Arenibacterium arenosum]